MGEVTAKTYRGITVLTVCVSQTLGDASAALKLIQGIREKQSKINIRWILSIDDMQSDIGFYRHFIDQARALGVNVVLTDRAMSNLDKANVKTTALIICFPYVNALPTKLEELAIETCTPLLIINEYNVDKTTGGLQTGLGKERLGVFCTEMLAVPNKITLSDIADDNIQLLQRLNLIKNTSSKALTLRNKNLPKDPLLFLGYFNVSYYNSVNNKIVNPQNFIAICLHLAVLNNTRRDINIVVRLGHVSTQDLDFSEFKSKFSSVHVQRRDCHEELWITLNDDLSLPKVCIIDPFPVDNLTFKILVTKAEPFMALTGDQSFSEGINRSALILYQIMQWKDMLALNFRKLCETEQCELLKQFNLKTIGVGFGNAKQFAKFVFDNQKALLVEMDAVRKLISERYDLLKNLTPKLLLVVDDPDRIYPVFKRYGYQYPTQLLFSAARSFNYRLVKLIVVSQLDLERNIEYIVRAKVVPENMQNYWQVVLFDLLKMVREESTYVYANIDSYLRTIAAIIDTGLLIEDDALLIAAQSDIVELFAKLLNSPTIDAQHIEYLEDNMSKMILSVNQVEMLRLVVERISTLSDVPAELRQRVESISSMNPPRPNKV